MNLRLFKIKDPTASNGVSSLQRSRVFDPGSSRQIFVQTRLPGSLPSITYDFNMDYDVDIKPIAKNEEHFEKWRDAYPFYSNVEKEGVKLFDAA